MPKFPTMLFCDNKNAIYADIIDDKYKCTPLNLIDWTVCYHTAFEKCF